MTEAEKLNEALNTVRLMEDSIIRLSREIDRLKRVLANVGYVEINGELKYAPKTPQKFQN